MLLSSIALLFTQKNKPELGIKSKEFLTLLIIALTISILSFLAIYRFGTFDKEFHISLATSIFHNNVYPLRDIYRPDYILLYHYGGDLFNGAINYICKINIFRCYEFTSSILSATTFLSLFSLAWLLLKDFKSSLFCSFCTYFGGGLLWLDSIARYLLKLLPDFAKDWSLFETFFNIGIHGGIIDAPSLTTFLSTFGFGNPILILSLVIFFRIYELKSTREIISHFIFLIVFLLALFLTAEWLCVTFCSGILCFSLIRLIKKDKKIVLLSFILLLMSWILIKTLGNPLFLQDEIQRLGRANIFDVSFKSQPFSILSWGRLSTQLMNYQQVNFFSWEFISEFGLSFILLPLALIYLFKTKNKFAILLFSCATTTMPLPLVLDFKANPIDLNRLFCFGNSIIILLICCCIVTVFQHLIKNELFILTYSTAFCLSPLAGLFSATIFTPFVYSDKIFTQELFSNLETVNSVDELRELFKQLNTHVLNYKYKPFNEYKEELSFLKSNSKPLDVAISSFTDLPIYSGIYSLIPAGKWLYKDIVYSSYDSIYLTVITTLDPHLLHELNIKWLVLSTNSKNALSLETKELLNNSQIFNLVFIGREKSSGQKYEIYHTNDLTKYTNEVKRKTAWILVNKYGQPIEISEQIRTYLSLFPSSKDALFELKALRKIKPELKKQLITAQAIIIQNLEDQIKQSNLNIVLNKKFDS
ncbi:MAG: hypothetical protein HYY52_06130 [Candidatus Melainabacteria bacterium]|nr:hypothetical protein [Candidatus Melainabacteria bacterium]